MRIYVSYAMQKSDGDVHEYREYPAWVDTIKEILPEAEVYIPGYDPGWQLKTDCNKEEYCLKTEYDEFASIFGGNYFRVAFKEVEGGFKYDVTGIGLNDVWVPWLIENYQKLKEADWLIADLSNPSMGGRMGEIMAWRRLRSGKPFSMKKSILPENPVIGVVKDMEQYKRMKDHPWVIPMLDALFTEQALFHLVKMLKEARTI